VDLPHSRRLPEAPPGHMRHLRHFQGRAMAILLGVIVVAGFIVPAIVPYGTTWRVYTDFAFLLVLLCGVVAIASHKRLATLLAILSLVALGVRWGEWLVSADMLPLMRDASALGALTVLAIAVGINVFGKGYAVSERVFGAIVLYLLIGLTWAVAYAFIHLFIPKAFNGLTGDEAGLAEWVYFSFVTLTTVGYGDITPVARVARSAAIVEALVGQLYPAIIIARLISLPSTET
jgi:hypothetical protein